MNKINQKLKNLILVIITITLTLSMVIYLGKLLDPEYMWPVYSQIKAFHSIDDNSIDVITYGSSKMWKGLAANELSEEIDATVYNYGCNWQRINTTRLFFKDSLYTQSPKIAIVDTFNLEVLHDCDMNGEIYYTRYMPNSNARKEFLKDCFQNNWGRYLSYYFPLISFHEKWDSINEENFTELYDRQEKFIKSSGYNKSNDVSPQDWKDYTRCEQQEIPDDAKEVLDEITNICKENNITLIYVIIPAAGEYHYFDAMEKYAAENNVAFVNLYNMDGEDAINGDEDFQDVGHLNYNGSKKVSHYLGKYIRENIYK